MKFKDKMKGCIPLILLGMGCIGLFVIMAIEHAFEQELLLSSLLLVSVFIVLVVVIIKKLIKKSGTLNDSDERQLIVQGKAFKYAIFVMGFGVLTKSIIFDVYEIPSEWTYISDFLILLIPTVVFLIYCLINDGLESISERTANSYLILGILYVCLFIVYLFRMESLEENIYLVIIYGTAAIIYLVFAIIRFVKAKKLKLEEALENEKFKDKSC